MIIRRIIRGLTVGILLCTIILVTNVFFNALVRDMYNYILGDYSISWVFVFFGMSLFMGLLIDEISLNIDAQDIDNSKLRRVLAMRFKMQGASVEELLKAVDDLHKKDQ